MVDGEDAVVARATGGGKFQVGIETGEHHFLMDEPVGYGGLSSGPSPFDMLGAALGACTLMTMRLYGERKGWIVDGLSVRVSHRKNSPEARDQFERTIHFEDVSDEQRARLLAIAERCPVHLLLERGADVTTTVAETELAGAEGGGLHEQVISELCDEAA
jgi:putative redox protein